MPSFVRASLFAAALVAPTVLMLLFSAPSTSPAPDVAAAETGWILVPFKGTASYYVPPINRDGAFSGGFGNGVIWARGIKLNGGWHFCGQPDSLAVVPLRVTDTIPAGDPAPRCQCAYCARAE